MLAFLGGFCLVTIARQLREQTTRANNLNP